MADTITAGVTADTRTIEKHGLGAFPTVLLLIALGFAGAFMALEFKLLELPALGNAPTWALAAGLKASGIVVLALTALVFARGADRFLALALGLSAVGDVALNWEPYQLLAGMGAFGAAHLVYVAVFARRLMRDGISSTGILTSLALVIAGGFIIAWLFPAMGDMALPSLGYMGVLFAMAALALLTRGAAITALGALSFVASDTMIAIGLYMPDIHITPGAVWVTYVGAQALILVGMLMTARPVTRS